MLVGLELLRLPEGAGLRPAEHGRVNLLREHLVDHLQDLERAIGDGELQALVQLVRHQNQVEHDLLEAEQVLHDEVVSSRNRQVDRQEALAVLDAQLDGATTARALVRPDRSSRATRVAADMLERK